MNVLITAGGTTEKIDEVRAITNSGTGTLGTMIAERFAEADPDGEIIYLCSQGAVRPSVPAEVFIADDTASLEWTVREICTSHRIDAIVHSMAVSDYRPRIITNAGLLAESLEGAAGEDMESIILSAPQIEDRTKIRSGHDNLVVVFEKTPKIISMLRGLQPDAVIVGFKLLVDTPKSDLIAAGLELLEKNGCDFVFANDMRTVSAGKHTGWLIDKSGQYSEAVGKENIADLIVSTVLNA